MNPTLPRRAAAIAIAGTALATAPAGSQTLQYALAPAYAEGGNGAGGWYRVPVSVTYACPPPPGWVVVSCPPPETLGAGTLQATGPFVRTATFQQVGAPAATPRSVRLMAAPALPLQGVDGVAPKIVVTRPAAGRTYDAGVPVTAAYALAAGGGPAPQTVTGTVASGAALPVGTADDAATWGTRTFDVTARDAAGNTATASVPYVVDELPGPAATQAPANAQTVALTTPLTWAMSPDDGTGPARARVEILGPGGSSVEYDGATSPFIVPDPLPAGAVRWRVVTIDARGRNAASAWVNVTAAAGAPPPDAPSAQMTAPPTDGRPAFAWQRADGAVSQWVITSSGQPVAGPVSTADAGGAPSAPLGPGAYVFRVRQATVSGGTGPWSADLAFTVPAPTAAVAATRLPGLRTLPGPRLPTVRAKLLRPRPGARVPRRAVLRWARVRGARMYNVQLYRVTTTGFRHVASRFPRANRMRVPAKVVRKGQRYVWRVWPFMGRGKGFRARPVGVSWFRVR
ncbi:MAG: hypothetical protein KDC33_01560 [Thermoleophilia bacterium]|nr:hypothetical protein [Thermoleophilia bacterium]